MSSLPSPTGPDERPVLFVGAATFDSIALVSRFPSADDRVAAENVTHAGGGPAATAAVAAARLGCPAAFAGTVGDDETGERILDELRAEGVDTSAAAVARGERSGTSVIVVDRGTSSRAICNLPAPAPVVRPELLTDFSWVHTDHIGWEAVRSARTEIAAEARPFLSVDAGNPIPSFSPRDIDLYVPTDAALRRSYGELGLHTLLDKAVAEGARTVVATCGADGAAAATAEGLRAEAPAFAADIVSTLGAGDVFHGALIACVARGLPLQESLERANAVAALSCRALDGRSAIPTGPELDHHLTTP